MMVSLKVYVLWQYGNENIYRSGLGMAISACQVMNTKQTKPLSKAKRRCSVGRRQGLKDIICDTEAQS